MATVRKRLDLESPPALTGEERAELARLDDQREAIDYTDIAELDDSFWQAGDDGQATDPDGDLSGSYKFQIYRDPAGEYVVRFLRGSELLFQSTPYASTEKAQMALDELKAHGRDTPTETVN
ncbi:Uncharacterized conserved protein YegP, UPF0339 family [Fulvimarina manganoxydans]|uniref:Uncharacterized conserved protein YegP, UPF0339 family n=1 Tax=Fulvimarina manganoxydans TaxID=937218 RepID=A0A1W2C9C6_9HYPH|nr:hypothetical protein [Fulvimarina manganoxydans]SMC81584.1 Uncharacterized conserved protein YegP, UPF0339 family [Fulvimarina manganoxydans]